MDMADMLSVLYGHQPFFFPPEYKGRQYFPASSVWLEPSEATWDHVNSYGPCNIGEKNIGYFEVWLRGLAPKGKSPYRFPAHSLFLFIDNPRGHKSRVECYPFTQGEYKPRSLVGA